MYWLVFGFLTLRCWQLDGFMLGAGGTNLPGIGAFPFTTLHILGEHIGITTGVLLHTGCTLPDTH